MNAPTAVAEQMKLVDIEPRPVALPAVQQPTVPANVVTPADLLRIAMESGDKDIERLERLMAMDERYRQMQERERLRDAELAFRRDFATFRGKNIIIPKTKEVDQKKADGTQGPRFMQAEFDVVMGRLSPALSECGFGLRHDQQFTSRKWTENGAESDIPWVIVTCYLEHRDGHTEKLTLEGPPDTSGKKNPLQEMQSSASFLKRQSALAITGTATGGEDDESRLRPRGEKEAPAQSAEHEATFNRLQADGNAAAQRGMKPLTEWWRKLTNPERDVITGEFGNMKKTAASIDKAAGRA